MHIIVRDWVRLGLRVREQPYGEILEKLWPGDIEEVFETKAGWGRISSGWICLYDKAFRYVDEILIRPLVDVKKATNIWPGTYASLPIRPQPKQGVKYGNIKLHKYEILRIKDFLFHSEEEWGWVAGQEHTRYIYLEDEKGGVAISSVSAFYSLGDVRNFVVCLPQNRGGYIYTDKAGKEWVKIKTLIAGSWYRKPVLPYFLHHVFTFNGRLPKVGDVLLPVITKTGYGWVEREQVELN